MGRSTKQKTFACLCTLLVAVMIITAACARDSQPTAEGQLQQFDSYQELRDFVKLSPSYPPYYYDGGRGLTLGLEQSGAATFDASNMPDYSKTNIQVEGVDEADIVKTDGEYIYLAMRSRLVIMKAYPAQDAAILSEIQIEGTLTGLYVNGNRLILFVDEGQAYYWQSEDVRKSTPETSIPGTSVQIYDISNRESPVSKRQVDIEGMYWNSRMIGDYVYVVAHAYAAQGNGEVDVPTIYCEGEPMDMPASKILHSPVPDYSYMFTLIVALNVENDAEEPTYQSLLLGAASNLYVSSDNIYVTFPAPWDGYGIGQESYVEKTSVHRIHIDGREIEYEASGEVNGRVLNQFSMDEYAGYFRIATTTGYSWDAQAKSASHVFILNNDLEVIGGLEGLAPGEQIYSARFMGSRCYMVTFKKVDPLFVIDLKNPYSPTVLGALKITGYSDYLHPYDENHIIGIGKEAVEAEEGDFAWYQGLKISLFDVSDVANPIEIDKYIIGDRGTDSPVLQDHKAFLFDREKSLLAIPVLLAEIDETDYPGGVPDNAYGRYVWQGAYVMNISLDEGLSLRGTVTHCGNVQFSQYGYYDSDCFLQRSLYINDVLYTLSDSMVKMNDLGNLDEIGEVSLT
jgi:inhibitor of cysteine peptidase